MTPTIRRAGPNDAGFITRTILAAQRGDRPRGWFDIALGWPEPDCLAFVERIATAQRQSWWHVSQFIIAEVDGEPAAALCATPAAGTGAAARSAIEEAADKTGLKASELAAIFRRGAYTAGCWVQGGDGDWLIEHVASQPAHRGRGLVQALLGHALAAGQAAGFRRASISFLIGNEAAERCYARAGFVFAEEKRDPAFEALTGAPGFRRFERRC
ncbi:MAG TPA: GNAT family N-acetyltransferase [Bradyrhizobium sp.]|nr:GNAT family N-acetyltransferase [Bradyrhizobium sp.]